MASNVTESIASSIFINIAIKGINILFIIGLVQFISLGCISFCIEKNNIMDSPHMENFALFGIAVCACTLPNDLIAELLRRENSVKNDFEIVAGCGITMQI